MQGYTELNKDSIKNICVDGKIIFKVELEENIHIFVLTKIDFTVKKHFLEHLEICVDDEKNCEPSFT